jgi:hypothetical protein
MKHWSGSIVGFVDWKLGEYAKAPGSGGVKKSESFSPEETP